MNKVRKLAEELVEKHQKLFSTDFNENKQALGKVITIRNRALRNQLAGIISVIVRERSPKTSPSEVQEETSSPTIGDMASTDTSSQTDVQEEKSSPSSVQETPAQESSAAP